MVVYECKCFTWVLGIETVNFEKKIFVKIHFKKSLKLYIYFLSKW
jgi:hypothetical protein